MAKIDSKEASAWARIAVTAAGIWVGWQYVAKPLLETLNLKDTKEEQDNKKVDTTPAMQNAWDPNYKNLTPVRAVGGTRMLVPNALLTKYVQTIWDAAPMYWPLIRLARPEAVSGVVRDIKYKTGISDLADYFRRQKGQDLYKFLLNNFSSSDVDSWNKIVSGKPSGWFDKSGKPV